jgi:hypothetical protein
VFGDKDSGPGQGGQPVDLAVSLDPHSDPGDELFRQNFAELAGLDQGGIGVREHRRLRRRPVESEQRLMPVEEPEVR